MGSILIANADPVDELAISVEHNGILEIAGSLQIGAEIQPQSIQFPREYLSGDIIIHLTYYGNNRAYLDAIFLENQPPSHIPNRDNEEYLLKKVRQPDHDLMLLTRDVLTFAFPPITPSKEMVIYAHTIPSTASRPCFIYPTQNQSHRLAEFHTYQLNSKRGTLVIDGEWDTIELNRSSFSEFTQLGASYPEALVYGWILNDDAFLYLTIDFLPDNTPEPYNHLGVLYIQSGSELQRYIVSQTNKTWGCVGFTYTPRANYQHTIYEFKIPLANIHSQDTIQLMVHLCDG